MKILSGSSNPNLATKIAKQLNLPLINCEISKFANDEKRVWIKDSVAGEDVSLIQIFNQPVDEHIIETLFLIDALERAGVKNINLVIPWMGYSLQDKVFYEGEALAAKVIASLFSHAQLKRVIVFDLHNNSIAGFFNVPTQQLSALNLFVKHVTNKFDLKNSIVVSPDFGSLKKSALFAEALQLDLVNVDKSRDQNNQAYVKGISGTVKNKICLIFDDVINTGGTVLEVAKFLKSQGAKQVHFLVTHGLFAGKALEKMADTSIDSMVITNSISQKNLPKKIEILDASEILAASLRTWV